MSLQMLSMLRKWKAMVLGYSGAKEPNDIPPTYDRNVVDWCSAGSLVLFSLSLSRPLFLFLSLFFFGRVSDCVDFKLFFFQNDLQDQYLQGVMKPLILL